MGVDLGEKNNDREFIRDLFTSGIPAVKVEEWVRRKQALTTHMLANSPRLYPGVVELVRESRIWRYLAREHRGRSGGIAAPWGNNCWQRDAKAVKPDPEAYLLACKQLFRIPRDAVGGLGPALRTGGRPAAGVFRSSPSAIAVPWRFRVRASTYISGSEPVEGLLRHLGLRTSCSTRAGPVLVRVRRASLRPWPWSRIAA